MRYAGTALTDYFGTPDFTGIGKTMMDSASLQRNTATKSEGYVNKAGIFGSAEVKSAGFQADAIEAQGQAQGQQAMASGIGNMFSGLAGGIGSLGSSSSSSSSSYTPGSVVGAHVGATGGVNRYNVDFNSGRFFSS